MEGEAFPVALGFSVYTKDRQPYRSYRTVLPYSRYGVGCRGMDPYGTKYSQAVWHGFDFQAFYNDYGP